ncbi:hypothetical protein Sru01_24140 [Sphaerisporangium rufum]|uniref:Uncharacterized protein n=1 Tax=Sphaerisporangium rufum TaxID=1381558 RepID=A0A919R0J5_9ACTN|nr:hypothetical protein [Sphaerisporangium rufum]GII77432.1 hypothetical protein Sru01_24140 [Sphaerisporangium rufum]
MERAGTRTARRGGRRAARLVAGAAAVSALVAGPPASGTTLCAGTGGQRVPGDGGDEGLRASIPDPGEEAAAGDIHSHEGNGTRNHNIVAVRSPTYNHGYQHNSPYTVDGATGIQNALCRGAKVCKITLNLVLVVNGRAERRLRTESTTSAREMVRTFIPAGDDGSCG